MDLADINGELQRRWPQPVKKTGLISSPETYDVLLELEIEFTS